jgi:hypothetical protein
MQFQIAADNPGEASIAEYIATVMNLQDRLCVAGAQKKMLEIELGKVQAELAELKKPKEAPHLEAVPKESA